MEEAKKCFEPGCTLNVEWACECTSPETYYCELHFGKHYKLTNKTHFTKPIFVKPCEATKKAILEFLAKEKLKNNKQKKKLESYFRQKFLDSEIHLKEFINNLNSRSVEINNCFSKISQTENISIYDQDPILGLLGLHPEEAVEKIKKIYPTESGWYENLKMIFGLNEQLKIMIESFIKNKFESYLDERLFKIEKILENQDKTCNWTSIELSNVKESISNIIIENEKSKSELEAWKESMRLKTESEINSLNSQINDSISSLVIDNEKNKSELNEWRESMRLKTEAEINLLNSQITEKTKEFDTKLFEVVNAQSQNAIDAVLILQNLREKRSEIFIRPNDQELDKEFRITSSIFQKNFQVYDPLLSQAYKDFNKLHNKKASIYNTENIQNTLQENKMTNLVIYKTEKETKKIKVLETPESIGFGACIAQLPNGQLFCFGSGSVSGVSLIIDENYKVRTLPSGPPCRDSSAIYFNENIYCFGGFKKHALTLSCRFNLIKAEWSKLKAMPQADYFCHSILVNDIIMISQYINKNLLRYHIAYDNFTITPYEFAANKRKILVNLERLYLIECGNGLIYESEILDESAWTRIGASTISNNPWQVYWSFNKGSVYIGCNDERNGIKYFKFDLNSKLMAELAHQ